MISIVVASLLLLTVSARQIEKRDVNKVCTSGSSGDYPNCVCENGSQFNRVHNVCPPRPLESLTGSCPDESTG